jgi:hypothetical protein
VAVTPDGKLLASVDRYGNIKLWDVATGRQRASLWAHDNLIRAVAFTADGKTLVSGSEDKTVKLWDVAVDNDKATLKERATLQVHAKVLCLAITPDGRTLATGYWDGNVNLKLWDLPTGRERATLKGHRQLVHGVAFRGDGKILASAGWDGTVRLWEVATARERACFTDHDDPSIRSVAFTPDGKTLASAGSEVPVKLWEVATRQERAIFGQRVPRLQEVICLTFTADGKTLASAHENGTVTLWEVATGRECASLSGHTAEIRSVAFTPDGKTLASGSLDRTVKLWDLTGLRYQGTAQTVHLPAERLERLWTDLGGADAVKAYQAIWAMAAAPGQTVPFLEERLRAITPAGPVEPQRLARLIADLDNDAFAVREKATQELEALAELTETILRQTLEGRPSAEVRRRVEGLLDKVYGPVTSPDRLRGLRAIEVLEQIGTSEACVVLRQMTRGPAAARLTHEAKASLDRLAATASKQKR